MSSYPPYSAQCVVLFLFAKEPHSLGTPLNYCSRIARWISIIIHQFMVAVRSLPYCRCPWSKVRALVSSHLVLLGRHHAYLCHCASFSIVCFKKPHSLGIPLNYCSRVARWISIIIHQFMVAVWSLPYCRFHCSKAKALVSSHLVLLGRHHAYLCRRASLSVVG